MYVETFGTDEGKSRPRHIAFLLDQKRCSGGEKVCLHGYLAHNNQPPPGTLQKDYTEVPTVVLGGGGCFL